MRLRGISEDAWAQSQALPVACSYAHLGDGLGLRCKSWGADPTFRIGVPMA